MLIETIADET